MKRNMGMNRRRFLGAAGAGAAGVVGAAMMGSGVAHAQTPTYDYVIYGALPDGLKELSVVSETQEFLDLVASNGGPVIKYMGGGIGKSLVPGVSDGTYDFGKAIINTHGIGPLELMSELYWGMPFGMEVTTFVEWLYSEGMNLFNEIFDTEGGVNAFAIPLYLTPGEGGAWHTEPIPETAAEFAEWGIPDGDRWGYYNPEYGQKSQICKNPNHPHYNKYCVEYSWTKLTPNYVPHQYQARFFGLGGNVIRQAFPPGIPEGSAGIGTPTPTAGVPALNDFMSSKYNGIEFYMPTTDIQQYVDKTPSIVNLPSPSKSATVYYESCWFDNVTMSVLWVNNNVWQELVAMGKHTAILEACEQTFLDSYIRTVNRQYPAMQRIRDLSDDYPGFEVKDIWPEDVLNALKQGAIDYYNHQAGIDPSFKEVLLSMRDFILTRTRWSPAYSPFSNVPNSVHYLNTFTAEEWEALLPSEPLPY